jgi:hypothetical protein
MPREVIIVARGELDTPEFDAAILVLGGLGLTTEVMDPALYERLVNPVELEPDTRKLYPFEAIVSREQFLGREHIFSFRQKYAADTSKKVCGWAFRTLVAPSSGRRQYEGHDHVFDPAEFGLVVMNMEDAGFSSLDEARSSLWDTEQYNLVVQVGSALDFLDSILNGDIDKLFNNYGPEKKKFIRALFEKLNAQISDNPNKTD